MPSSEDDNNETGDESVDFMEKFRLLSLKPIENNSVDAFKNIFSEWNILHQIKIDQRTWNFLDFDEAQLVERIAELSSIYSDNPDTLIAFISSCLNHPIESNVPEHRILSAMLVYLPNSLLEPLTDQIVAYLTDVLTQTEDCYTQVCAMMALEQLNAQEVIEQNESIQSLVEKFKGQFKQQDELAGTFHVDALQAIELRRYLCAHALATKLSPDCEECLSEEEQFTRLNADDRTEHLQLSPSRLMARSTHRDQPQTVRSKFAINTGSFYFEVTILTAGSIRIGLAAKNIDINEVVGSNDHSIGFDGHYVWCGGQKINNEIKDSKRPKSTLHFNAGDVVGCGINSSARLLIFTINDQICFQVKANELKFGLFANRQTHVTLTLFPHQQCYINFNCANKLAAYLNTKVHHPKDWYISGSGGELFIIINSILAKNLCIKPVSQITNFIIQNNTIARILHIKSISQIENLVIQNNTIERILQIKSVLKIKNLVIQNNTIRRNLQIKSGRQIQNVVIQNNRITENCYIKSVRQVENLLIQNNIIGEEFHIDNLRQIRNVVIRNNQITDNFYIKSISQVELFFWRNISKSYIIDHLAVSMLLLHHISSDDGISVFHQQQSSPDDASKRPAPNPLWSCQFCSTQTHVIQGCNQCKESSYLCLICVPTSVCQQCIGPIESTPLFSSTSVTFASHYLQDDDSVLADKGEICRQCQISLYIFRRCTKCNRGPRSCYYCASCSLECPSCNAPMLPAQTTVKIPLVAGIPLYTGSYFYEAKLYSSGKMHFGWTTRLATFNQSAGIIDANTFAVFTDDLFQAGDTIGCLVDIEQRQFLFFKSGRLVTVSVQAELFNYLPLFPAAVLSTRQLVEFNFGQVDFKYPPPSRDMSPYKTLLAAAEEAQMQLQLLEPKSEGDEWRFDYHKLQPPLPLCFPLSSKQLKANEWVKGLENDISYGKIINNEAIVAHLKENCFDPNDEYLSLRYLHALVEVPGDEGIKDRVDVLAYWIDSIVHSLHPTSITTYLYDSLKHNNNLDARTSASHRNFCIILASISELEVNSLKPIGESIITYLNGVIRQFNDPWTQLYALVALINTVQLLEVSEVRKSEDELIAKWAQFGEDAKVDSETAVGYQLYLCSNVYQRLGSPDLAKGGIALNVKRKSPRMRLSPSRLIARSDHTCESIRSKCPINLSVIYFEVTVCTSGPMRIGLVPEELDIKKVQVGSDDHSIAFDGYYCCLWKADQKCSIKGQPTPWQVGDTIGWYVNREEKRVNLTLNGNVIEFDDTLQPKELIFSDQLWYAAVSLPAHQQCHFKFNCPTPVHLSTSAQQSGTINIGAVHAQSYTSKISCLDVKDGTVKADGDLNLTSTRN